MSIKIYPRYKSMYLLNESLVWNNGVICKFFSPSKHCYSYIGVEKLSQTTRFSPSTQFLSVTPVNEGSLEIREDVFFDVCILLCILWKWWETEWEAYWYLNRVSVTCCTLVLKFEKKIMHVCFFGVFW